MCVCVYVYVYLCIADYKHLLKSVPQLQKLDLYLYLSVSMLLSLFVFNTYSLFPVGGATLASLAGLLDELKCKEAADIVRQAIGMWFTSFTCNVSVIVMV